MATITQKIQNEFLTLGVNNYKQAKVKFSEATRGWKKSNGNYAFGVLTGKPNNIVVVDLDCYKWGKDHPFTAKYGTKAKFIKEFNTYTVSTVSGGIHLYFNYCPSLYTIAGNNEIDIRSNGGYVVGCGSYINNREKAQKGYYRANKDRAIADIPKDLVAWLKANCYPNYKDPETREIRDEDKARLSLFSYHIPINQVMEVFMSMKADPAIILKLGKNAFWHNFTEFCVSMTFHLDNDYDTIINEWREISALAAGFDADKNERIWNAKDDDEKEYNISIEMTLKAVKREDLITHFKLITLPNVEMKPNELITTRYLSQHKAKFYEHYDPRCLVVRSGCNTGKTSSLITYIKDNPKETIISITTLCSLAESQFADFNKTLSDTEGCFQIYNDGGCLEEGRNTIIQLDSIQKISNWYFGDATVFLDEANSLITYLHTSPTFADRSHEVVACFIKILKNCKRIICVDADISEIVFKFLEVLEFENDDDIYFIQNKRLSFDAELTELANYDELLTIAGALDDYAIFCDSASEAMALCEKLNSLDNHNADNLCVAITAQTQITEHPDNIRRFVASPKIITGIDLVKPRAVFGFYKCQTITPQAMAQQIMRVRNPTAAYILFAGKKTQYHKNATTGTYDVRVVGMNKDPVFQSYDFIKFYQQRLTGDSSLTLNYRDTINADNQAIFEDERNEKQRKSFSEVWALIMLYNDIERSNCWFYLMARLANSGYKRVNNYADGGFIEGAELYNKERSECLEAFIADDWRDNQDTEHKARVRQILKLEVGDVLADEWRDLFYFQHKLSQHFNIIHGIHEANADYLRQAVAANKTPLELIVSVNDKLKVLYYIELIKKANLRINAKGYLECDTVNADDKKYLMNSYMALWRDFKPARYDYIFKNEVSILKHITMIVKRIFGNELIVSKNVMENRVRSRQYWFNKDLINKHIELFNYKRVDEDFDDMDNGELNIK